MSTMSNFIETTNYHESVQTENDRQHEKKGYFQVIPVEEWTLVKILHKLNVNKPLLVTETNLNILYWKVGDLAR